MEVLRARLLLHRRSLVVGALAFLLSGCGALYYGAAALFILANQGKSTTVITSAPDAIPTADVAAPFATLRLSTTKVTVQRTAKPTTATVSTTGTTQTPQNSQNKVDVTDFEILGVDFPPGYGEARSNRDTGTALLGGDKLVLRVNGDSSKAITFDDADATTAVVGTAVAVTIQAKVRALTPTNPDIPATAYTLFTAAFDPSTGSYIFRSGAPGVDSSVAFLPPPRSDSDDAPLDEATLSTGRRLGLGLGNGEIDSNGSQNVGIVVMNAGNDVIPSGTKVNLYLSHDKLLDPAIDLLFDQISIDTTVQVGEARRFFRIGSAKPPETLLRQDVTAGSYFILFEVESSGGEKILTNNMIASTRPIELYQPFVDPAVEGAPTAVNTLDFAITDTQSQIGVVTSGSFTTRIAVTNMGAPVPVGGVPIGIDVVLSSDLTFQEPAAFLDAAKLVAGVRINPTDPARPIVVTIQSTAANTSQVTVGVGNNALTVTCDATTATIQSLVDALNAQGGGLVDAFTDGNGSPSTQSIRNLIDASQKTQVVTGDVFVGSLDAVFPANDRPLQTLAVQVPGRIGRFTTTLLPLKLVPFFRIRPSLPAQGDPENTRNNIRQAVNYVRVYDRAKASFDSTTGATLPTVNSDDFAQLEAVTQRPVNTGSIRQGQQRVFRIEIPQSGLTVDESQLLMITRAGFDAHTDLLSASGEFLTGNEDGALLTAPLIYTPVQALAQSRIFYVVVSAARRDESDLAGGGTTFELTISVNPRLSTDSVLVASVFGDNLLRNVKTRRPIETPTAAATPAAPAAAATTPATTVTPLTENNVLIPFTLQVGKAEVMFVLPQRARVRFRTKPVFAEGVTTTITQFIEGQVPAPIDYQAELDENFNQIVYRPRGGDINTSHVLAAGVYTFAFQVQDSSVKDTQPFRLEIDTEFIALPVSTPGGQ